MHVRVADVDHVLGVEGLAELDQALHRLARDRAMGTGEQLLVAGC